MPIDLTAPIASAPADRLNLSAAAVRGDITASAFSGSGSSSWCTCFFDEATPSSPPPGMCAVMCCGCFADDAAPSNFNMGQLACSCFADEA